MWAFWNAVKIALFIIAKRENVSIIHALGLSHIFN